MKTFRINKYVYLIAVFLISIFKNVPVARSSGLQILDLLFQNQTFAQCVAIYIHGSEELELIEKAHENYHSFRKSISELKIFSMCIKYVVLSSSFKDDPRITREVPRYAEISSIILLPAMTGYHSDKSFNPKYIEKVVYDVFDESFHLSVDCLFLIVDNDRVFRTNVYFTELRVQEHPANMIVIKLKITETVDGRNVMMHYLQYLCDGYCPQHWKEGQSLGELLPPIKLHKKNMNGANLRSINFFHAPATEEMTKKLLARCYLHFAKKHNALYCDSRVMLIVSLKKMQNLTVTIHNSMNKLGSIAFLSSPDPYIKMLDLVFSTNTIGLASKLSYSHENSKAIFYCNKDARAENGIKFMHWFEPFTAFLWLYCFMLLGIPFLVTFISTSSGSGSLGIIYGVVGVILRQFTDVVGRKLLIFTSFFGLIVGGFYESQITSLAIVQLPPETIQSLQELLQKGYKILRVKEYPVEQFENEFKMRKLLDKFNESWFIYGSIDDDYDTRSELQVSLLATQKYAVITSTFYLWDNLVRYTKAVRNAAGVAEFNCHNIPDELVKRAVYWEMTLKNRYWVLKSIRHTYEAGLHELWNRCSKRAAKLQYITIERRLQRIGEFLGDSLFHKKNLGPALITVQEVGGFLLLALCPYITSIVMLVVEIYFKNIKTILNGIAVQLIMQFRLYRSVACILNALECKSK
ncbi:unnamed protein product [Orchesella dallaii]|uniref:Uncharacterized protein n=1 Tax=Orchesella dallaii TaxID=48710 RepID=A0ABP1RLD7_9HEXA